MHVVDRLPASGYRLLNAVAVVAAVEKKAVELVIEVEAVRHMWEEEERYLVGRSAGMELAVFRDCDELRMVVVVLVGL